MLYFSYDISSALFDNFKDRHTVKFFGVGELKNYKVKFKNKVTIEPELGSSVFGTLYWVDENVQFVETKQLLIDFFDDANGVPEYLDKVPVKVKRSNKEFDCFTFIPKSNLPLLEPESDYYRFLLDLGRLYKIPLDQYKQALDDAKQFELEMMMKTCITQPSD